MTVYIRNLQTLDSAMYIDFSCTNSHLQPLSISFTDDYHKHKTIPKNKRP